jgi:hypothetical protein
MTITGAASPHDGFARSSGSQRRTCGLTGVRVRCGANEEN